MVTLTSLIDNAKCYELIRKHRWPDGVCCTRCGCADVVKRGKDDTQVEHQRYRCKGCKHHFDDLCFLHGFLSIRDRSRIEHGLHQVLWQVYHSDNDQQFRERMAQFWHDCQQGNWSEAVMAKIEKFCHRVEDYALSYQYPDCNRTSNLVDRLMNRLTRYLYNNRGIHGHLTSSERRLRGWALLQNFRPFAPRSGVDSPYQSPAHRLNQKQYHAHWLHNLQTSASLAGKINGT